MHNPDQAKESLNKSMAISQDGIKILDDAMKKRSAVRAVSAVPASVK
jgi:hypothetical protein